jgi:hypothetical protein
MDVCPFSRRMRTLWGASACLLLGVGCGLPPCFEGKLDIEVLGLDEQASSCHFEGWPQGTELQIESTGSRENIEDICRSQGARYAERPEGELGGTVSTESVSIPRGYEIAEIEGFGFEAQDCSLSVSGSLFFSKQYDDFESALDGQAKGNGKAFFIRHHYSGSSATCGHLFSGTMGRGESVVCGNTPSCPNTRTG